MRPTSIIIARARRSHVINQSLRSHGPTRISRRHRFVAAVFAADRTVRDRGRRRARPKVGSDRRVRRRVLRRRARPQVGQIPSARDPGAGATASLAGAAGRLLPSHDADRPTVVVRQILQIDHGPGRRPETTPAGRRRPVLRAMIARRPSHARLLRRAVYVRD